MTIDPAWLRYRLESLLWEIQPMVPVETARNRVRDLLAELDRKAEDEPIKPEPSE